MSEREHNCDTCAYDPRHSGHEVRNGWDLCDHPSYGEPGFFEKFARTDGGCAGHVRVSKRAGKSRQEVLFK